jgi:hypothetical protein
MMHLVLRLAQRLVLFLINYAWGRRIIGMLTTLWTRANGKAALVRIVTAIIGLSFKQMMMTDQQLGGALKAARVEHDRKTDDTIPAPDYPMPEADWEDFATGLELLGGEISLLFSLPAEMVWEMFDLSADRFLARVAA